MINSSIQKRYSDKTKKDEILSIHVRIAYYYSVGRTGCPASAQENASRRSGKVVHRGHVHRYEPV